MRTGGLFRSDLPGVSRRLKWEKFRKIIEQVEQVLIKSQKSVLEQLQPTLLYRAFLMETQQPDLPSDSLCCETVI